MADKIWTLVLNVDLECAKCNKKIRKALCKFDEIRIWSFDEKQKKVIISGTFNPYRLIKLYWNVGCKIIEGHEIMVPKPPPPPPPPPSKPPKDSEPPKAHVVARD